MWTQTSGFQRHGLGDPVLLKWSLPVAILLWQPLTPLTLEAKQTHALAGSCPKLKDLGQGKQRL
jgi:hypothetical protein